MFQMTFAIITPALIIGAFAERMRFAAVLLFTALWLVIVYVPVAHWVWGGGWLVERGVHRFRRRPRGASQCRRVGAGARPHDRAGAGFPEDADAAAQPGMTMTGACMLWVGWFGFNAGSALKAGGDAGMAMTGDAYLGFHRGPGLAHHRVGEVWKAEHDRHCHRRGRWSCHHHARFRLCRAWCCTRDRTCRRHDLLSHGSLVKRRLKIDDSLDVFAVHGVGGATGVLLTAIFADATLGGIGLAEGRDIGGQFAIQLTGVIATLLWSLVASFFIIKLVQLVTPLRGRCRDRRARSRLPDPRRTRLQYVSGRAS